jgi:hypothetical protein
MDIVSESGGSEARFNTYLDALSSTLGHADRAAPFHAYCTGLLLPGERKSVEPMAARVEPERVQARHQSLHHLVAKADWSDAAMLTAVRNQVLPAIQAHGAINAWIVDDTGFPKKGTQSVGVARQYCGQLGKQDNCQVAVSLSVANDHASLPIAYQLYLPEAWASETPCVNVSASGGPPTAESGKPQSFAEARPVAQPMSAISPVRSLLAIRPPEDLRHDRAAPAQHRALPPSCCSPGWVAVCPATPQIGPAGRPASAPRQPIVAVDCADRRVDDIG